MDENLTGIEKYLNVISCYDNEYKTWEARVKKIIRRYRDDNRSQGGAISETAKFNILWSNVQTLIPAVYAKMPKASVARRFGDTDQVGRVASLIIERALDFEIEHYPDFRATMKYAVQDRFLGGRGVAWVRYEPHLSAQGEPPDGVQVTEDTDEAPSEQIEYECAPVDYIHWRDFGHNVARTWDEVTIVWRWVYMAREALVKRFGEAGTKLPLDSGPDTSARNSSTYTKEHDRAKICELWDKDAGATFWFAKDSKQFIDARQDPLQLDGFFPCAAPIYATLTSDSLIPVPDFVLYQDQANELDILSDRIDGMVKALRVRGVYDASQPALQRLLTEGDNNTLIPVDKWMGFSEKGGLKGSIDLLPLDTLAAALLQCYQARDNIKNQIYEITGISDIIRGQTKASETATAQQIKGQYAGLRLRSLQEEVALFASELLRLKAQIICSKFQPQTILSYAAANQMQPADQALISQAMQVLKDKPLRNFRIEVASDSLVQIDESQNKADRMEFLRAFTLLMQQAIPAGQNAPEMIPLLGEVVRFGIGAFKQAASIEGALDKGLRELANPEKQQKPDPAQMKAQMEMQLEQVKLQSEAQAVQGKLQMEMQAAQAKLQMEMQIEQSKLQMEMQIERMKLEMESQKIQADIELQKWKAQLDASTKISIAQMSQKAAESERESSEQDIRIS